MKKKITLLLGIASALCCCMGLTACNNESKLDTLQQQGYTISVTYDANGGVYLDAPGTNAIMDLFNPDKLQKDSQGNAHISLKEPTDTSRETPSVSQKVSIKRDGYFLAGWYEERTVKTENGTPVDDNGRALKLNSDGTYAYANPTKNEEELTVIPAYEYSDPWDFSTPWDIMASELDEIISKTLYAGWVKEYEFNYYYQQDGEWTLFGANDFDYHTVNMENSTVSDYDTIWLPQWSDGAMNHAYTYADSQVFNFPKVSGKTFAKAYLDKECTQEITTAQFEHRGSLDYEHALAINPVENIYVTFTEGEQYKIQTAAQFANHINLNGYYEIMADLDFTDIEWPTSYTRNTFTGKMYSTEGQTYAIKNVAINYVAASEVTYGGMFGQIGAGAEIKNLTFENVTVDFATAQIAYDSYFGLFAGYIQDAATISGVTVGGALKIGTITSKFDEYAFHLLANGETDGITQASITAVLYGVEMGENLYVYTVIPTSVSLKANGAIQLQISSSNEESDQASYEIKLEE